MQFGHFDDVKKEYVITSPKTPLPWINYLGSENFFSLISNTCGGYSFYKDAKLLRLTRYRYNDTPLDQNGRYYYIKDGDTVWNPGWQPTQTPLDSYECHHGLGYSRFVSSKNLVAAELTAFVPLADSCEVNRLMLTNNGTEEKTLALTSFVEFCFWNAVDDMTNFQRNFSIGEVEIQGSEIYHKTEYRERRRHYAVYAVNCPINGYDTDRDAFLGAYRGNDRPETVLRGTAGNTVASGWGVIGSHHIDVTLKPGESRSFIFVLGYCENAADDKWEAPGVINKKPAKKDSPKDCPNKMCALQNYITIFSINPVSFTLLSSDVRCQLQQDSGHSRHNNSGHQGFRHSLHTDNSQYYSIYPFGCPAGSGRILIPKQKINQVHNQKGVGQGSGHACRKQCGPLLIPPVLKRSHKQTVYIIGHNPDQYSWNQADNQASQISVKLSHGNKG